MPHLIRLSALLLSLALLAACRSSLLDRPIAYQDAREAPELRVPRDLVAPRPNPALQLPPASGSAGIDAMPPPLGSAVAVASTGLPRSASSLLTIEDSPESAWRRVGLALTRSACCRIVGRDEQALRYEVELIQAGEGERRGWMSRMFRGPPKAGSSHTLQLAEVSSGTRIQVVDGNGNVRSDDAARTLLGVLESRLR